MKNLFTKSLLLVVLLTFSGCEMNFGEKSSYSFTKPETPSTGSTGGTGSTDDTDDVQGFLDSWAKSKGGKSFTVDSRTFTISQEATTLYDAIISRDAHLVKIDADSATYYIPGSGGYYTAAYYYKFNITSSKVDFIFVSYKSDGSINALPGVLTYTF